MKIRCVYEHNGNDTLLYSDNYIGAFTRGETKETALEKMEREVQSYLRRCGRSSQGEAETDGAQEAAHIEIVQEKESTLQICDADSDVLFNTEREPLTQAEYEELKGLALKSAEDFLRLYEAIPNKRKSVLPVRKTFYGQIPRTAEEMYEHTKNVNNYYWSEIGVTADNEGTILVCRRRGFETLEQMEGFLQNGVFDGSYDEQWSLRKVLRRFIWHDRIHAKAMYRMALKTFPEAEIPDIFAFGDGNM